ncbi:glycosyltransferase [Glaciecola sp. KUL10]|uniref:glycosyltransferase n=1 Tax=Glaciecola sp. (strain KUL10) TaxID=2161813 RepID=UPI000D7860D2|nr:glycosyltransferase [Glaciecola sp. KUL10]GBL04251.1 glycosyltransferase [Glaciecola sp. KUL10]
MSNDVKCSKPLHVTHVVYRFSVGGLEQIIKNTIATMPSEIKHSIVCLTSADKEFVKSISKPVDIIELNRLDGQRINTFKKMYHALRALKPDVLHTYNLATIEFQLLGLLLGIPTRLHAEHGRDLADPDGTNSKYIWWRKLFSRFTHYHVGVSNDLFQWLVSSVQIPDRKAKLIYNGINTEVFLPLKKTNPEPLKRFTFGHVARLDGIKNQANLIRAFARACKLSSAFSKHCRLVLVGDGDEKQSLCTLIKNSSVSDSVEMWGARSEMPCVYQQFNTFVLSSDAEGTPMSMLEAMATGLPILSTNVGGIPEVVNDDCAYLVPPNDSEALAKGFLYLFENRQTCLQMGCAARERVIERFSQAKMNNEYLSIYKSRI